MSPLPNIRARLSRASRNNVQIQSATDTFRRFKWFSLGLAILFPIYPSLSLIGSDASAHGSDYDDSSIITAYSDDSLGGPDSLLGETGLVSLSNIKNSGETIDGDAEDKDMLEPQNPEPKKSTAIIRYTVQAGDTLAKLSDRYDVSIDAIRWANDVDLSTLKPGMTIKIPPTSGVVHMIAKGDTISAIAAKYDISASDILAFNKLTPTSTLRIGMELMIPGAQKRSNPQKPQNIAQAPQAKLTPIPQDKPSKTPVTIDENGLKSRYAVVYTGKGRGFVAGNCTWYVAQNKTVTWRGNANQWMRNAKAQ